MGGNVWSGSITLPSAQPGRKYRLVIREYEIFLVDRTQPLTTMAMVPPPPRGKRLVYADVIEL